MTRSPSPTPPLPSIKTVSPSDQHHFSSPPRASTLPQKQTSSSHRSHHHHHHHRPHRSYPHHRRDKSVPQSAIERSAPSPFGDLLRRRRDSYDSEKVLPADDFKPSLEVNGHGTSRDVTLHARRENEDQSDERNQTQVQAQVRTTRLRQRRKDGEASLKSTLTHLSDLSTTMTRRLDYTYYAFLTSLSLLTRSVESFHALAKSSRNAHESFTTSTTEIERNADASIQTTKEVLDRQTDRVNRLQERMERGRSKVKALSGRLDKVKEMLEEAERVDGEGRRRVGRRWRMLWSFVGFWASVLVIGLVLRRWGSLPDPERDVATDLEYEPLLENVLADTKKSHISVLEVEAGSTSEMGSTSSVGLPESRCAVGAEASLRLLDEL